MSSKAQRVFIVLLLVALGLRLASFVVSVTHIPACADEAIIMLQAEQILRGHFPLLFMCQPYLFPMESYLTAPLFLVLPHNAFGASFVPVILNTLACFGLLWLCRRVCPEECRWPAVLLILFTSPYTLMVQTGTEPPSYSAVAFFSVAALMATVRYRERGDHPVVGPLVAGLLCGLAVTSNLIAVPVLVMCALSVFLGDGWRTLLRAIPSFCVGAFLGLLPYLIGVWTVAGCGRCVTQTLPWNEAWDRLWRTSITVSVPYTIGPRSCLYPDNDRTLGVPEGVEAVLGLVWLGILLTLTVHGLVRAVLRLVRERRLAIQPTDVLVGISWMCLVLFAMNRRSNWHSFRYLLPIAWVFPFLVCRFGGFLHRRLRPVLLCLVIALAGANAAVSIQLMQRWVKPGFAVQEADLFDYRPALAYAESLGIHKGIASYWLAYRIDDDTAERFVCSQPFNERYYGWPVPYKEEVDASTNVAYLLAPHLYLVPEILEQDMRSLSVTAKRRRFGDVTVYTNFRQELKTPEIRIPRESLHMSSCDGSAGAAVLGDGDRRVWWRSPTVQTNGMWIQASMTNAAPVARVSIFYDDYPYDQAVSMNLLANVRGRWVALCTNVAANLDAFEFRNGHPIYGAQMQTFRFPPVVTDAIRLEIAEADSRRCWTVGEMELYLAGPSANP